MYCIYYVILLSIILLNISVFNVIYDIIFSMIEFINELYLTEKTKNKLDKIRDDILNEKWMSLTCIIILSECERDVFDIIPVNTLNIRKRFNERFVVLGIAENKKAALKLCSKMIEEYMMNKNYKSMREYFKDKLQ